jgi:predicted alpha/beta hydrolase
MALAIVQSTIGTQDTAEPKTVNFASNVTAGNLIVVCVGTGVGYSPMYAHQFYAHTTTGGFTDVTVDLLGTPLSRPKYPVKERR